MSARHDLSEAVDLLAQAKKLLSAHGHPDDNRPLTDLLSSIEDKVERARGSIDETCSKVQREIDRL